MSCNFNPISLEIHWSRLISIADEAAAALLRTSFSTIVRELNDFATVLMDVNGDSLAENSAGIPSFVGILPRTLKHFISRIPLSQWKPAIASSPTTPGWRPAICRTSQWPRRSSIGASSSASRAQSRICRISAGSGWGADAREIFEEGLRVMPVKFLSEGQIDRLCETSSSPTCACRDQVTGRPRGAGHGTAGVRRVADRVPRGRRARGPRRPRPGAAEPRRRAMRHGRSRRCRMAPIAPASTPTVSMRTRRGIECAVTVSGGLDCISTTPAPRKQIDRGLNWVKNYTHAYSVYPIKCALDPLTPRNEGSYRSITVDGAGRKHPQIRAIPPLQRPPADRAPAGGRDLQGARRRPFRIGDRRVRRRAHHARGVQRPRPQGRCVLPGPVRDRRHGGSAVQRRPADHAFPTNAGAGSIEAFESISPLLVCEDRGWIGRRREISRRPRAGCGESSSARGALRLSLLRIGRNTLQKG